MAPNFSDLRILHIASSNPGKIREFREAGILNGLQVEALPDIDLLPQCVEDGLTFEDNARKKALHYSRFTDGIVFADDSGLVVDALGSAPGVHSARYAGPQATDEENNRKLLAELARLPGAPRTAHYVCVIAVAQKNKLLTVVEGRAEGTIIAEARGNGGFGYDPYFLYSQYGKTFAELAPREKLEVSHRGDAFRKLLYYLREI